MKGKIKHIALCLAVLFTAAFAFPAAAGSTVSPTMNDYDKEKLTTFWHQPAYNGLNNGETVYDHEWNAGNYYGDMSYWVYDGSWRTELITQSFGDTFEFWFAYYVPFWVYDDSDPDSPPLWADGRDYVYPDLYGPLDLAGTQLRQIRGTDDTGVINHTHISSIDLDGCSELLWVRVDGQYYCKSISALDCGKLSSFRAKDSAYTHIAFSLTDFEADTVIDALGPGSVGAYAKDGSMTVYAYPTYDRFIGWYRDGARVSTAREYTCEEGCELTAYFGGDVDSNGVINAADALILLRRALGLAEPNVSLYELDVNASGMIDATDALIVLRIAMGLE